MGDVWQALDLGEEPEGLLYAVNKEYADAGRLLEDGDEVALIPPVSGGAFTLSEKPLELAAVVAEVADERAGGIAVFAGVTRIDTATHFDNPGARRFYERLGFESLHEERMSCLI